VRSYADHWLETVARARARLRPATWTNYSYAVRVHIGPSLGSVRLRSLTPARVRRFLAERTEAGLAANSVRIIHATLRTMLAEAVRDELEERNVAAIVRGPRIDHEEVRPWSLDEAATFLAAASTHRLSALFAVGVAVGLRRASYWPLPGTMLILMAGSFGFGERSNACGVKVWCSGRRSRPDRVGASRYRSPRARRCCLTVSARKWSGWRRGTHGKSRALFSQRP
jgi:site-specific recombinase XerC